MLNQKDIERFLGQREIERMELIKRIENLEAEIQELRKNISCKSESEQES